MCVQVFDNLAARIIQITKNPCTAGAGSHACRFDAFGDAMIAKVTFISRSRDGVEKTGTIGAGINTDMTADAYITVDMYHTIFGSPVSGAGGTQIQAGRIFTLVTQTGQKMKTGIGLTAFANFLDPTAVFAVRHIVFAQAGNGASMATGTTVGIDYHGIFFGTRRF